MNKELEYVNDIYRKGEMKMEEIINNLNIFLSDLNVFYRKLQNYHWNIKGKDFFTVHAKLEEYYNEINVLIDEVAEHILSINGQPLGTLKDYLNCTKIKEAENKKIDSTSIFKEITKDYSSLLNDVINIKKLADMNSENKTSALMDEIIESYTKKLWMLKQYME